MTEPLQLLFIGGLFGFVTGLFIGAFSTILYAWRWLQSDPDGPGGWRNRMQALSTEHDARVHSITTRKP